MAAGIALALISAGPVRAQQTAAEQIHPAPPAKAEQPDFWHGETLTGNWGGLRTALALDGIEFTAFYVAESFRNLGGGIKPGTTYDGLFLPQLDVDLDKLLGWHGASVSVSMIQAHGPAISIGNVGDLLGVSSTSAVPPTTRLYDLWLQQSLLNDAFSVRAGLQHIDTEFMVSATGTVFVNPGWLGLNLPAGGPVYPLPAPAVRLRASPDHGGIYWQGALFSGDPTGHDGSTVPARIPTGTVISFSGGTFLITEVGHTSGEGQAPGGPTAAYRLGGWYHTGNRFADQRYATDGLSLANPASTGVPRDHRGNWGIYAMVDRSLLRTRDGGVHGFLRIGTSPGDRSLLTVYADAGIVLRGLVGGRPGDSVGVSVSYARLGRNARGLDQDTRTLRGDPTYPVRRSETVFELTYQALVTPWMTLQPDLQYVIAPSGGVRNPDGSFRRNALVAGLRSVVTF